MNRIHRLIVGQMKSNCYIYVSPNTDIGVIIDPGDDADYIMQYVGDHKIIPVALIATHGHFDHIMAAGIIQDSLHIPFYIHDEDVFLIDRMQETATHFLGYQVIDYPPKRILSLGVGKSNICNIPVQIAHTPGHTPGSVCIQFAHSDDLFVGDLLFENGLIGRTDFSYSDKQGLITSLTYVLNLPDNTMIRPGHGESANVGTTRKLIDPNRL